MLNRSKLTSTQIDAVTKLQVAISDFLDFIDTDTQGRDNRDLYRAAIAYKNMYNSFRRLHDSDAITIEILGSLMLYKEDLSDLLGRVEVDNAV